MKTRFCKMFEVLACIWLCSCFACAHSASGAARPVRVGIFQNAPIVFKDAMGHPEGIYVDLLKAIAAEEGWELTFIQYRWGQLLEAGKNGNVDLLTSIAYAEERTEYLDYSKEIILTMWGQVYAGHKIIARNITDLSDKRVAILSKGINGVNFIKQTQAFNIHCRIVEKESYDEVMLAVESGEVDAGILNSIKGRHLERIYDVVKTPIIFGAFNIFFAAPHGNADLLRAIDEHVSEWKKDDSSTYYKIISKWTGEYHGTVNTGSSPFKTVWVVIAALLAGVVTFILVERYKEI